MNKVVAHFQSGKVLKGLTMDFIPTKERFHLIEEGAPADAPPREIALSELKGLFFVRDLEGDLGHAKSKLFDPTDMTPGRKIRVEFKDGEILTGITQGYSPDRLGFFVVPSDKKGNTERAFVIMKATNRITFV
jgi:hypothetical protein